MKLVTFLLGTEARSGVLMDSEHVLDVKAAGFGGRSDMLTLVDGGEAALRDLGDLIEARRGRAEYCLPLSEITLQAPIPNMRRNVFCVGRNYRLHIMEAARARGVDAVFPIVPEFFTKPTTAVIGPGAPIHRYAHLTQKLDYEVELGVVLGKRLLDARPDDIHAAIFGYTVVNDISARDLQFAHNQWFKGKGLDSFCPIGPCIVTADEFGHPSNHRISLRVNGETRQDSDTSDLLFSIIDIIASLSAGQTLLPGDIIATGTPAGVAFGMTSPAYLQTGDIVEAEVEGIGVLRNEVD